MTITATFETLDEMEAFAMRISKRIQAEPVKAQKTPDKVECESVKEPEPETESAAESETVEAPAEELPFDEAVTYTLPDVRAKLAALNKAGKKAKVQEIIESFGASKLSQIDPKDYPALMQKAGEADA